MLDTRRQDQVEHEVLVSAVRRGGALGDHRGEPLHAPVASGAAQELGDLPDGGDALGLCLADGALEPVVGDMRSDLAVRGRPSSSGCRGVA